MAPIGVIVRLLPNVGVGDVTLIDGWSLNADDTGSTMADLLVTMSTLALVNEIGAFDDNCLIAESFDGAAFIDIDGAAGNVDELLDDRIDFASFATVDVADATVVLAAGSTLLFVVICVAVF